MEQENKSKTIPHKILDKILTYRIGAGDRTKKSHAHTIVIRLYGISIDSILFVKNIFHAREKSIFQRLHMEKIQYQCLSDDATVADI